MHLSLPGLARKTLPFATLPVHPVPLQPRKSAAKVMQLQDGRRLGLESELGEELPANQEHEFITLHEGEINFHVLKPRLLYGSFVIATRITLRHSGV